MTDHKAYRGLSSKIFLEEMKGRLIADTRNWLNHASLESAGFTVLRTGIGADAPRRSATEAPLIETGPAATVTAPR